MTTSHPPLFSVKFMIKFIVVLVAPPSPLYACTPYCLWPPSTGKQYSLIFNLAKNFVIHSCFATKIFLTPNYRLISFVCTCSGDTHKVARAALPLTRTYDSLNDRKTMGLRLFLNINPENNPAILENLVIETIN